MVAHRGNPSTWETEAGGTESSKSGGRNLSISVSKVPAMGTWVQSCKLSVLAQTGGVSAGEVHLELTGQLA